MTDSQFVPKGRSVTNLSHSSNRSELSAVDVTPAGDYSMARIAGSLIFTAGMTPRRDGALLAVGTLGVEISVDEGRALTEYATTRALAAAESVLNPGQRLVDVVSVSVFLAADPSFAMHSQVADGATELIQRSLPGTSLPVRAAVGVSSLPGGAPVEVQLVASWAPVIGVS